MLTPDNLEQELQTSATQFIRTQLGMDVQRALVFLPKVFDVYRNDFGNGEAKSCLLYCMKFLVESDQEKVIHALKDDHTVIKVRAFYSILSP